MLVGVAGYLAYRWRGATSAPGSGAQATLPFAGESTGLARTLALRGIVLDARGRPLAGARGEARPWSLPGPDWLRVAAAESAASLPTAAAPPPPPGPTAGETATSSGPGGLFLLMLPPGRYDLELGARGLAARLLEDRQPGGPPLVAELEEGYSVSGVLRRFSADARLDAEPLADEERRPVVHARPDAEGRFVLDGLGLGPYRITGVDATGDKASAAPVRAGTLGLVLSLLPRRQLTGLVLDAREARPVSGAQVTLAGSGVWPPRSVRSDADGRYRFPGVPTGWYVLRAVREPDLASGFLEGVLVPMGGAETEQPVVVERQPPAEIEVRRTSDGTPVPDAQVTVAPLLPTVLALRGSTNPQGRFRLGPLAPGRYRITVRAPGLLTVLEQGLEVGAAGSDAGKGPTVLPVAMLPAAALEGVVTDQRGTPVAFAELFAVNQDGLGGPLARAGDAGVRQHIRDLLGVRGAPFQESVSRSDPEGRFHLDGLPPGEWNLLCLHITHLPALVGPYRTTPGEVVHGVQIRMEAAGIIGGQVVDAEGDPVLSAKVRFDDQASTATDAQGRFVLTGIHGEGRLVVQAGGYAPQERRVRVEAGAPAPPPLLITLDAQLLPLRGFVLGPGGEEVGGATVVVQGAGGLTEQAITRASGDFALPNPPPPPWTVTVTAAGAARWQRQVPRVDGPLEIDLQAGGSLRLEVLEEGTFDPLPQVHLTLDGPEQLQWSGRPGNGYLAIDQLAPGRYGIQVEARGYLPARLDGVTVEDRRDPDPRRVVLARGGGLGGVVRDLDGAPLAGALVRAVPLEPGTARRPLAVRTDATGTFHLSPLAEGQMKLTAAAPGYQAEVHSERVVAGEEFNDLEFRLTPNY